MRNCRRDGKTDLNFYRWHRRRSNSMQWWNFNIHKNQFKSIWCSSLFLWFIVNQFITMIWQKIVLYLTRSDEHTCGCVECEGEKIDDQNISNFMWATTSLRQTSIIYQRMITFCLWLSSDRTSCWFFTTFSPSFFLLFHVLIRFCLSHCFVVSI